MTRQPPTAALARIHACATQTLDQQPRLPCRVAEMTPREYAIYQHLSTALAALESIARWSAGAKED